jgi:hypothetical protein
VLIVISDGGDNASRPAGEVLARARRIITIYTIGLFDAEDRDRTPAC